MPRFPKKIAVLLSCLLGGVLLLYVLATVYLDPYLELVIVANVRSSTGITIAVGEISGNYLSNIILEDVSTLEPGKKQLTSLAVKRAKFSYSLTDLVGGSEDFLKTLAIDLQGLDAELDLRSREQPGVQDPQAVVGRQALILPALLPQVKIRDSTLAVQFDEVRTVLKGVLLDLGPADHGENLSQGRIKADQARVLSQHEQIWSSPVAAEFSIGKNSFNISSVRLAETPVVNKATIRLQATSAGVLAFDSDWRLLNGRLELAGRLAIDVTELRGHAEAIDLESISAALAPLVAPMTGEFDADLSLRLEAEKPDAPEGALTLALREASLGGLSVDQLSMDAHLSADELLVRSLSGVMAESSVVLTEFSLPARAVFQQQFETIFSGASGSFTVKSSDLPAVLEIAGISKPTLEYSTIEHRLLAEGVIDQGRLTIHQGKLEIAEGTLAFDQMQLAAPPPGQPWSAATVSGEMTAAVPDLKAISDLFGFAPLGGNLTASLSLDGTLAAPQGTLFASGKSIAFNSNPLGDLELSLTADAGGIVVEQCRLRRNNDRVSLTGAFTMEPWLVEDVLLTAAIEDIALYQALLPGNWLTKGSVQATLAASGPVAAPDLRLDMTVRDGQAAKVSFQQAEVSLTNTGNKAEDLNLRLSMGDYAVTGSGSASHDLAQPLLDMQVDTLAIARGEDALQLSRPARVLFDNSKGFTFSNFDLRGSIGQLSLDGAINQANQMRFRLTATDLAGSGWLDLFNDQLVMHGANATITIEGQPEKPFVAAKGDIAQLGARDVAFPLSGRFDLQYSPDGFQLKTFEWRSAGDHRLSITGTVPLNPFAEPLFLPARLELEALIEAPELKTFEALMPAGYSITGTAHGKIALAGTWDNPAGHVFFKSEDLLLSGQIEALPPGPFQVEIDIDVSEHLIDAKSLQVDSPQFTMTAKGQWTQAPSLRALFGPGSKALTGEVSAQASLDMEDVGWAASGIDEVQRMTGRLQAKVSVQGKAAKPQVTGILRFENGELRGDATLPAVKNLFIEAEADIRSIQLRQIKGELGGSPFTASGSVERQGDSAMVAIQFQGENLLFYREEGLRVRADADLAASGPLERMDVTGDIWLTKGRFTKNFNVLNILSGGGRPGDTGTLIFFSLREPPMKNARFAVRFGAKNPFTIRNNVAKGEVRPDLFLSGTGEFPVITGRIYVDPSRIDLPAGRLKVESGIISFRETDPGRPLLDIIARSRMMGYDINVGVEGPYDEPVVKLSSSPPLPKDELLLLLVTGTIPKKGGDSQRTAQQQGVTLAVYFGQAVLSKWFTDEISELDSVLDRFEIELGRGVTRTGEETINAQFRLKDDVLREGDSLYVTTEKDVFDQYNLGLKFVVPLR